MCPISDAPHCDCCAGVIAHLLDVLLPFAAAGEYPGNERSLDEAFIWEPDISRRPLVTFGHVRRARAAWLAYGQLTDSCCKPSVTTRGAGNAAESGGEVKTEKRGPEPP